jgi:peptidoglycan hydrolase-like protein with peptidoglycan-binding domain
MVAVSRTHLHKALGDVAGGQRVLHRGDKGPAVEQLQRLLNRRGAHLKADGDFGPKTEAAVKHFQQRKGCRRRAASTSTR